MSTHAPSSHEIDEKIDNKLIRDLVEEHPEIMPILNQCGIDICCGGGLTVPQAAAAHELDQAALKSQVFRIIRGNGK